MSKDIGLSEKQVKFLMAMLEINDIHKAIEKFSMIMIEEGVSPVSMPVVVDRIMRKMK